MLTKVAYTKLSNAEHDALLEMAGVRGQSISEFIHDCVMEGLCGSWKRDVDQSDVAEKVKEIMKRNRRQFGRENETLSDFLKASKAEEGN